MRDRYRRTLRQTAAFLLLLLPVSPAKAQQDCGPIDVHIDSQPFLGNADAPVTLVAFTEYQCRTVSEGFLQKSCLECELS